MARHAWNLREWSLPALALLISLLLPPAPQAAPRSEDEVRTATQTWVRTVTGDKRPDAVVEAMEPYLEGEQVVGYIVQLSHGGFCLAGADDLVLPVYLYVFEGTYDPSSPELRYFLDEISSRVLGMRAAVARADPLVERYRSVLDDRARFWSELAAGRTPPPPLREEDDPRAEPDSMVLPLTSFWHQGEPYNDQCPLLTPPDEHAVVGCVATAGAQVMRYWTWPVSGEGSAGVDYAYRWRTDWDEEPMPWCPAIPSKFTGRLEWTPNDGGKLRMNGYWDETIHEVALALDPDGQWHDAVNALYGRLTPASDHYSADFGATTYDWSLLLDYHDRPPDAGDVEVAKLCLHVGIATGMEYGLWGSASFLYNVIQRDLVEALEGYFRYDTDVRWSLRDIATLTEEIQYLRPAVLGGQKPESDGGGGHAWVVLGYNKATDPDRQFLMQLGWGFWAAWYSCDSIPWNEQQENVTRIAPEGVVRFTSGAGSGDGTPGNPYGTVEEALIEAPDGARIIFKAGGDYPFSANTLIVDRPLILEGRNVTIRKGS